MFLWLKQAYRNIYNFFGIWRFENLHKTFAKFLRVLNVFKETINFSEILILKKVKTKKYLNQNVLFDVSPNSLFDHFQQNGEVGKEQVEEGSDRAKAGVHAVGRFFADLTQIRGGSIKKSAKFSSF